MVRCIKRAENISHNNNHQECICRNELAYVYGQSQSAKKAIIVVIRLAYMIRTGSYRTLAPVTTRR